MRWPASPVRAASVARAGQPEAWPDELSGQDACPSAADADRRPSRPPWPFACSRRPWPSSPSSAQPRRPTAPRRSGRPWSAPVAPRRRPRRWAWARHRGWRCRGRASATRSPPPAPAAPAADPPPGPDERPTAAAAPAPPSAAEATPPARAREQVAAAPVAVIVRPPPPRAAPPRLAVMLDDLGLDPAAARRAIDLPPGVTLDFLPYGRELDRLAAAAAARGHDVFLHLPLEPVGDADPGPNALLTGLAPAEVARRLAWAFGRLPGAVGVNNHMGSRGTADPGLMLAVLAEVARRGLVFVDSRTTPFSVAPGIAGRLGLPFAARDVFLDNEPTAEAVQARLAEAERVARRHGGAIAIGHPYPATLAVLAGWLPDAERRGVRLVTARSLARVEGCAGVVAVAAAGGC